MDSHHYFKGELLSSLDRPFAERFCARPKNVADENICADSSSLQMILEQYVGSIVNYTGAL